MGKTIRNKIAGLLAAVSTCGFLMNGVSKVSARDFFDLTSDNLTVDGVNFSDKIKDKIEENKIFLLSEEFDWFITGLIKGDSKDLDYGFVPVNYDSKKYNVLVIGKNVDQSWIFPTANNGLVPLFTDDVKEAFINKWNELENNQLVVNPEKKEENKNSEPNNLNKGVKKEEKENSEPNNLNNDVKKEEKENSEPNNLNNDVKKEEKENNKPVEGQRSGLFMKIGISGLIVLSIVAAYALSNGSSSSTDGGNIGVLDVYDF